MSGTQVSSFAPANVLLSTLSGQQTADVQSQNIANQYAPARNQLLLDQGQQGLATNEMDMIGRAAQGVLSLPADQRPGAYTAAVGNLQRYGFAKNAPAQYPGDAALQGIANQSIPVADQYKLGLVTPPGTQAAIDAALGRAPTAPGSAPPAAAPGTGVTIGQRQNNPGNLTFAGQPGASPGQGNRFASFPDMPTGVAANADQLARYQTEHGVNTVRGAVTRWVGDPKADLTSYIGDISKAIGVGPDDKIDLTDPNVQAKFILAQFPHESAGGGYVLNPADVQKGVQMAAANRGQVVQAPGTAIATAPAPVARGVAARTGGTDVAGPGAGPPASPTAAPAATTDLVGPRPLPSTGPGSPVVTPASLANTPVAVAAVPQPPPNALAPPAPQPASAQPQSNLPHASEVPTGVNSAQYQQAMELQRKALALDAIKDPTGRAPVMAAALRAQAALAMQADSVVQTQEGQVHTLTGKQDDPAKPLPHYVYSPDAGGPGIPGYIDTTGVNKPEINPARRMNVRPDGSVINDQGQVIAPAMPGATPPLGSFEVQKGDYTRDAEELPKIAAAGQNAQTAQVRLQTMLDLLPKISTGAGGYTRTQLANLAETAGFPGIAQTLIAHSSDGDAGAAQEFGKLTLAAAGAAERGDLGSRGSLGALKLYQQNNPGLDLRPGANKAMIGMQLIAAQADTDYSQAALSYANKYATDFRTGQGPYSPLANFDLQWQQQRNPQVYSAAMGALNGQPPATWAKGLSDDEYKRALDIVSRASPSAKVQGKSGWISMQPNATPPPPPGFTVVQ